MNDSQGYLKTPTPYSDKSDIPFGLMEDVIPTAIAMTPTGEFDKTYESLMEMWAEDELEADDLFTVSDVHTAFRNLQLSHNADMQALKDKRIAELEAQVPKVVVPTEHDRKRGTAYCACEAMIAEWDKYCNECGAQLNWTEEAK